jgi:hypothetical protein
MGAIIAVMREFLIALKGLASDNTLKASPNFDNLVIAYNNAVETANASALEAVRLANAGLDPDGTNSKFASILQLINASSNPLFEYLLNGNPPQDFVDALGGIKLFETIIYVLELCIFKINGGDVTDEQLQAAIESSKILTEQAESLGLKSNDSSNVPNDNLMVSNEDTPLKSAPVPVYNKAEYLAQIQTLGFAQATEDLIFTLLLVL